MFNTSYPDTAYKNPLPCYLSVGHKIFLRHPELYYIPAFLNAPEKIQHRLHTKNAVLSIPAKLNLCLCCNQGELSGHIRMYPLLCFEISNMVTSAPKRARGIAFFPQEPYIFCSPYTLHVLLADIADTRIMKTEYDVKHHKADERNKFTMV